MKPIDLMLKAAIETMMLAARIRETPEEMAAGKAEQARRLRELADTIEKHEGPTIFYGLEMHPKGVETPFGWAFAVIQQDGVTPKSDAQILAECVASLKAVEEAGLVGKFAMPETTGLPTLKAEPAAVYDEAAVLDKAADDTFNGPDDDVEP